VFEPLRDERYRLLWLTGFSSNAARWMDLVSQFTGGDPSIAKAVAKMWQTEESIHGLETASIRKLGDYLAKANAG